MNYRPIDITGQTPSQPGDMPAPMLDWLPIAKLVVDDRYQRPLTSASWSAIYKIAASFHWSRFSPVLVAPIEGGLYAIIDGQHRTHAAALCGFDQVPAMAVHMTTRQQASAFTWVNGQVVRINQHQVYRAALTACEDWALRCREAVEAAGCKLMTYNASNSLKKPREIYGVMTIKTAILADQDRAVTAALSALRQADVSGRVAFWNDYVVRPLIAAAAKVPMISPERAAEALTRSDPYRVIEAAKRTGRKPVDGFTALFHRACVSLESVK